MTVLAFAAKRFFCMVLEFTPSRHFWYHVSTKFVNGSYQLAVHPVNTEPTSIRTEPIIQNRTTAREAERLQDSSCMNLLDRLLLWGHLQELYASAEHSPEGKQGGGGLLRPKPART